KDEEKQFYNRIPRLVLQTGGFSVQPDQLTAPRTWAKFVDKGSDGIKTGKATYMRRIPLQTTMTGKLYFENIKQVFVFVEIMLSTSYRLNTYSFFHADKIHAGQYSYANDYEGRANLELAHDHTARRSEMDLVFDLGLQFPAYDYYNASHMMDATNVIKEI